MKNKLIKFSTGVFILLLLSCKDEPKHEEPIEPQISAARGEVTSDTLPQLPVPVKESIDPDTLLAFSKTLIGVPYLYASTDPSKGFDCSGFITYVFNHFGIKVPRSSVDFTNYGRDISKEQARPGDLILFTGTDSTIRIVGHMGIVESNDDTLRFIHSTSGKLKGVVITPMGNYYNSRFVKLIRVFPDESFE